MQATAHLVYDRQYYETNYRDWLVHRSKWQRRATSMAITLILFGIGMTILFRQQWLVGIVFSSLGFYELFRAVTHKSRWVNARLKAIGGEKTIDIEFDENEMKTTSSMGYSRVKMDAFDEIITATNGIFLIPENGVSIYVPHSTVDPQDEWQRLIHAWTNRKLGTTTKTG